MNKDMAQLMVLIDSTLNVHSTCLDDLRKLIGIKGRTIEVLQVAAQKQVEINEDMTVLLVMQREMIERNKEEIDSLKEEHRQYGDHMNQGG